MDGFDALRLAARRPHPLRSSIPMSTSADASDGATVAARSIATGLVRRFGFAPIAKRAIERMFGPAYLADGRNREAAIAYVKKEPKSSCRPLGAVIDRPSVARELARIGLPTLVILGEKDTLLPPPRSLRLAAAIPGAKLVEIPGAGHLVGDERPAAVTKAIAALLTSLPRRDGARVHREF